MKIRKCKPIFLIVSFITSVLVLMTPSIGWGFFTNHPAEFVIGQPSFEAKNPNQGQSSSSSSSTTLNTPVGIYSDGQRLFITDENNHRLLIYNSIPSTSNPSADVVVGQINFSSSSANQGGASPGANTLKTPDDVFSEEGKLFIVDRGNNRVLIYNTIPSANNTSADIVIGQPTFSSSTANQGGGLSPKGNTLYYPLGIFVKEIGGEKHIFLADLINSRVLIYKTVPSTHNVSADIVVGQSDLNKSEEDRDRTNATAQGLNRPKQYFY